MPVEHIVDVPLMDDALQQGDDRAGKILPCLLSEHPPDIDGERVILRGVLAFIEGLHLLSLGLQLADALL